MLAVLLALLAPPTSTRAQVPYQLLDGDTEVRSLSFRFPNGRSFPVARLQALMATSGTGPAAGLRRSLAFLPLVTAPGRHPFSPLELQRDVARLRQYYATSGFLEPDIRYDVSLDREHNMVDVVMIIDEGRPLALTTIEFQAAEQMDATDVFPDELRPSWQRFVRGQQEQIGRRLGETERTAIQSRALNWMMDRGYAFAETRSFFEIDTAAARAALTVVLDPGPRARIDSIAIEGNRQVDASLLRGTTPLRAGDWFSASRLAEGQRRVFALDLFRLALADVPPQPRDSLVTVRLRVQENPPRFIGGEAGYSTEAGVTVRGQWAHRNFMGGARTFQLNATAQTGYRAIDENPDRRYQLGLSFTQPAFLHPRLTLAVRPFGEYRDVLIDRSWQAGIETSLVYELGAYRYLSFQHRLTARRVLEYNVSVAGIDLFTLDALNRAGALDDIARRVDTSIFAVAATIGRHDPTSATRTLQARPTLEVTTPGGLNTIEWARADVTLVGHLPLGDRIGFDGRAQLGRMFLFGSSAAPDDDPAAQTLNAILLREVLFTAGGTGSVRGWGNRMLGPKWPDVRFPDDPGADSLNIKAESYLPLGGLSRMLGSLELRLPFPGLGPTWGTHLFIDAARIGNFQGTLQPEGSEAQHGTFFGAGGGIDVATPVGPLRLSLGYKLNPSPFDLRRPADVLEAILDSRPLETAPVRPLQRLHLHLSIGQSF